MIFDATYKLPDLVVVDLGSHFVIQLVELLQVTLELLLRQWFSLFRVLGMPLIVDEPLDENIRNLEQELPIYTLSLIVVQKRADCIQSLIEL